MRFVDTAMILYYCDDFYIINIKNLLLITRKTKTALEKYFQFKAREIDWLK